MHGRDSVSGRWLPRPCVAADASGATKATEGLGITPSGPPATIHDTLALVTPPQGIRRSLGASGQGTGLFFRCFLTAFSAAPPRADKQTPLNSPPGD